MISLSQMCRESGRTTKMRSNKKGQGITLGNLATVVVLLVVAGLVATFAGDIVADINADQTANSVAANVISNTNTGLLNLTAQFGNLGTVIGAGLIIGVLLAAFAFRQRG